MQLQVAKFCIVRKTKLGAKLSYKKRKLLQTLIVFPLLCTVLRAEGARIVTLNMKMAEPFSFVKQRVQRKVKQCV